mgnify:CR=1 FL=1
MSETDYYVDGGLITGANYSAIYNQNALTCSKVNFVGNNNKHGSDSNKFNAGSGGGAIRSGTSNTSQVPSLTLQYCNFQGNTSTGAGGAVLVGVSNDVQTSYD